MKVGQLHCLEVLKLWDCLNRNSRLRLGRKAGRKLAEKGLNRLAGTAGPPELILFGFYFNFRALRLDFEWLFVDFSYCFRCDFCELVRYIRFFDLYLGLLEIKYARSHELGSSFFPALAS